MKVVSVINYKGGVGKTTVTANLAGHAARRGKRVLMIDLDPQTNLTFSFIDLKDWEANHAENRTLRNFFEPIINENEAERIPLSKLIIHLPHLIPLITTKGHPNGKMDIISSHLKLIDIDLTLAAGIAAPSIAMLRAKFLRVHSYLRESLKELKDEYDLVLIDCPPNFSTLVRNAITASDYYVVPARMDFLSTLGIDELNFNAEKHINQYNEYISEFDGAGRTPISTRILGVIPTMETIRDRGPILSEQQFEEQVKKKGYDLLPYVRYNAKLFGTVPASRIPVVFSSTIWVAPVTRTIVGELVTLGDAFLKKIEEDDINHAGH